MCERVPGSSSHPKVAAGLSQSPQGLKPTFSHLPGGFSLLQMEGKCSALNAGREGIAVQ